MRRRRVIVNKVSMDKVSKLIKALLNHKALISINKSNGNIYSLVVSEEFYSKSVEYINK